MSKDQKDLEIKANELGKELDDDEIEAVAGGAPAFNCGQSGYDIPDDRNNDGDDSNEQSCGGIATGFNPNPAPIERCNLCTRSGHGYIIYG
jgi:hypothetical protein